MKFITPFLLTTALALPGTPIEERQAVPSVVIQFYDDNSCNGKHLGGSIAYQLLGPGVCIPLMPPEGQRSTLFTDNTLTQRLIAYTTSNCGATLPYNNYSI
ncbi:hypothetical protein CC78DRAFT_582012 [Lojkania enalia]|uniref:Uncharacterized protein n=1 Tax=Lojkania enalia TaxID=147567 RepID=A0A9P4K5G9_9PLEO|nr:hypothetical protein CC78DRAFT_582012 [Didymosphaeria enalia]